MNEHTFLACQEQVLSYALESEDPAALAASRILARLHGPVQYSAYDTGPLVAALLKDAAAPGVRIESDSMAGSATGNPELVVQLLQELLSNVVLGPNAEFCLTLTSGRHTPGMPPVACLRGRFEGPGVFPEFLTLFHFFQLDLEGANDLFTRVTRDGRIDRTEEGVTFWLNAARVTPMPLSVASELLGYLDAAEARAAAARALQQLDGAQSALAANIVLPMRESLAHYEALLHAHHVGVASKEINELPPLVVRRDRVRTFWNALFSYIVWHLPGPQRVDIGLEYDGAGRQAMATITLEHKKSQYNETFHLASMRRAVCGHGGELDIEFSGHTVLLIATLPDAAGRALDAWIPGWDTFSPRARQMLRLLKGGGQAPPEELILGGVLEDELELRLLPRLEQPGARNIAKEIEAAPRPFAAADRHKKALGQVSRGKPKKEICSPSYAAEIIHSFGQTARGMEVLGLQVLSQTEVQELCQALSRAQENPVYALQLVARWT